MSLDTFEQSLLYELRRHVAARTSARPITPRRRTVRVAVSALATAIVASTAVAVGSGVLAGTAAYAVDAQPNGDVVVTIHHQADAAGLERALADYGVRADVRYVADFTQTGGQQRTPSAGAPDACSIALAKVDGGLRFTLGAAQIAGGSTLEIVTSGSSSADVGSPVAVSWSGGAC